VAVGALRDCGPRCGAGGARLAERQLRALIAVVGRCSTGFDRQGGDFGKSRWPVAIGVVATVR
jgi:hypothetical protein